VARDAGPLRLLANSLSMASIAEATAGDSAAARRFLEEAQALTAELDDLPSALAVLQARALTGLFEGDLDSVRSAATEGARLGREMGDVYTLEVMLLNLGLAAMIAGEVRGSKPLLAEALRIAHQIDDRVAQFYLLDAFGCLAANAGQARLAAQLLGAAETMRAGVGASVFSMLAPLLAQAEASAITALGTSTFEAEFKAGKRLHRDAAAELALGEPTQAAAAAADDADAGLLGRREADVARLVADGLSNKQIGARLFISERTVESHVRNILNKLGSNSRAQIAGWMAGRREPQVM
jgi:DNA-binding CsgD family transcriptional regulator